MQAPDATGTGEQRQWNTVEELCDRHLGARPSETTAAQGRSAATPRSPRFPGARVPPHGHLKFDAHDFTPFMARFFTVVAPGILPGAWGGMVPPFTLPGRHKEIDAYLRANPWAKFEPGTVMLDIGCGFPPQTSIEAAEAFPDSQIVAVDPTFEQYLLYDERQNYACLDRNGGLRYFQASRPEEFMRLYADRNATIQNFAGLRGTPPQSSRR